MINYQSVQSRERNEGWDISHQTHHARRVCGVDATTRLNRERIDEVYNSTFHNGNPRKNYIWTVDQRFREEYREKLTAAGIPYTKYEFRTAYLYARYNLMAVPVDGDTAYPTYEQVLEAMLLVKGGEIQ